MRQAINLFVQNPLKISPALVVRRLLDSDCKPRCGAPVVNPSAGIVGLCLPCRPRGDPIEPVAQELARSESPCLSSKYQECRLKRILGCMHLLKYSEANPENHCPVTLDNGLEREGGSFFIPRHKLLHELRISQSTNRSRTEKPIELAVESG